MGTRTAEGLRSRLLWVTTRRAGALVTSVAALLVALMVSAWVGPQPMHLGFQTSGDTRLADRVRAILGADGTDGSTKGYHGLAVVVVSPGQTRWAGLGNSGEGMAPTNTTMFEIGSITKLFTGLLLADAVDHGVVRLHDTVETYLPPLVGTPAGEVTLEELATHTSGLPAYADEITGATYEGSGSNRERRSLSKSSRKTATRSACGACARAMRVRYGDSGVPMPTPTWRPSGTPGSEA